MESETELLPLIFSGSGATIIVAVVALSIVLLLVLSKPLRNLIERKSFRVGVGNKHFEIGHDGRSQSESVDISNESTVNPAIPEADATPEIEAAEQEAEQLPLEVEGEQSFERLLYLAAYRDKDADKIEAAYKKLKSLHDRKMGDEQLETLRSHLRLHIGIQSGESELKTLEEVHSDWTTPSINLAQYYQNLARYDLAISHTETAIARADNDFTYAYTSTLLAEALLGQESSAEALAMLSSAMQKVSEPGAQASILDKIGAIHEKNKDDVSAAIALEHAINLTPSNKERRFRLAYLYSDNNRKLLALYHYRILESQAPEYSFTLNNLGALYGKLNLPGKNITTWKQAAATGQSYPVGNLAIEMIAHGFYEEAQNLLKKAPQEERGDNRIAHAFELLNSSPEKEDAELEAIGTATKIHHKYMLRAVDVAQDQSLQQIGGDEISGTWKSDSGLEIQFQISESNELKGEMIDPPVKGRLTGLFGHTATISREKYNMYLNMTGLVISGTAWPMEPSQPRGLLSFGPSKRSFFFVVTDEKTLEGFYFSEDKHPIEIVFKFV